MGAFLFSTRKVDTEKIKEVFTTRGHKDVKVAEGNGQTLAYASKVFVNNVNYLGGSQLGGGIYDFIIGVGTYIYKGDYQEKALQAVWQDIDTVLKDNPVYGHWAFLVRKGDKTYVLNDMSGTLRLYYVEDEEGITVTSSMAAAIASIRKPKFDRVRLSAFLAGGYGNEIPFVEGVENFDPLKYVVIEKGKKQVWVSKDVPETKRIEKLDDAVAYVKGLFKQQTDVLKEAIGDETVSIELTAGLDSRLIASNIKTAGINYDFLNYPLFGPDKEVSAQIAQSLGKRMLVQTNEPCTKDFEHHYGEFDYGFNFFRQYANPRWVVENKIQFSGARGECLDTPDIYSDEDIKMMKDPRIEVLLPRLTIRKNMTHQKQEEYKKYLFGYFEKRGFDVHKPLSEKEQVEFTQMLCGQLTGDYMYNSGVQAHIYFYQIYNEWHFNHFITDIAFKAKMGRKLTLALITAIDPELGSYPFVSRRRTKRKSVNETHELPVQYWGYSGIKDKLPNWVVDFIYKRMGRVFNQERFSQIDFKRYDDVIEVKPMMAHPNLYSAILNRLHSVETLRKIFNIE